MWKSAYVGVCQLLNWKMHGETLKKNIICIRSFAIFSSITENGKSPAFLEPEVSSPYSQVPALWILPNMGFHGEALLALRPTPKLEDHPLSAVLDCLFNIFAATLHIEGRSSIRNLRTRHAVVTGTHSSQKTGAVQNYNWSGSASDSYI
jgi:hypothetical protein